MQCRCAPAAGLESSSRLLTIVSKQMLAASWRANGTSTSSSFLQGPTWQAVDSLAAGSGSSKQDCPTVWPATLETPKGRVQIRPGALQGSCSGWLDLEPGTQRICGFLKAVARHRDHRAPLVVRITRPVYQSHLFQCVDPAQRGSPRACSPDTGA